MREAWARQLALVTTLMVLASAALFAFALNVSDGEAEPVAAFATPAAADPAVIELGERVYAEQGCDSCHAIAGAGNPRNPLDGIGQRLDAEALRHWTVASPEVAEQLPARIRTMKQGYAELSEADLTALVAYLQQLPPS